MVATRLPQDACRHGTPFKSRASKRRPNTAFLPPLIDPYRAFYLKRLMPKQRAPSERHLAKESTGLQKAFVDAGQDFYASVKSNAWQQCVLCDSRQRPVPADAVSVSTSSTPCGVLSGRCNVPRLKVVPPPGRPAVIVYRTLPAALEFWNTRALRLAYIRGVHVPGWPSWKRGFCHLATGAPNLRL